MFNYNEIKEFALNFDKTDKEQCKILNDILKQLGFTWQECSCKSLIGDLYNKLLSWLKRNKDGMLRYSIKRGVLFWCEGELVCFATLTNALAEKVKEKMPNEFEKYIKEVVAEEDGSGAETNNDASDIDAKIKEVKTKRTIKKQNVK